MYIPAVTNTNYRMLLLETKHSSTSSKRSQEDPNMEQNDAMLRRWQESMKSLGSRNMIMRIQPTLRRKEAAPSQKQISSILGKARKYARFTKKSLAMR